MATNNSKKTSDNNNKETNATNPQYFTTGDNDEEEQQENDNDDSNTQNNDEPHNKINNKLKVFFGGELFNTHDLIGNLFLVEAIDKVSKGKYSTTNTYLAQNQCNQKVTHQNIKDKDTIGVLNSDIALFAFEGSELDSGTVVEFIQAKTCDIPAICYRSDIRGGSGEESVDSKCNKWNLMVSFYPRTKIVYFSSIIDYQNIYQQEVIMKKKNTEMKNNTTTTSAEEKKFDDNSNEEETVTTATSSSQEEERLRLAAPPVEEPPAVASIVAKAYSEYIAKILVNAMDEVLETKPILCPKEKQQIKQQCIKLWGINPTELSDSPYPPLS